MNSQEEKERDLLSYPKGDLESPFLEGEFIADEPETVRGVKFTALLAESPFAQIRIQELNRGDLSETDEQKLYEEESPNFWSGTNDDYDNQLDFVDESEENLDWETHGKEWVYEDSTYDEDTEEGYKAIEEWGITEENADASISEVDFGFCNESAADTDLDEFAPLIADEYIFDPESLSDTEPLKSDHLQDFPDEDSYKKHRESNAVSWGVDLQASGDLEDSEIDTEQEVPFMAKAELFDEEVWSDSLDQLDFRDRVLAAHIARSRKRSGMPKPDLTEKQLGQVDGTEISMRLDAAEAASKMLRAARSDLEVAQAEGEPDALKTSILTATSGYRSSDHQKQLWLRYFRKYYDQTQSERESLPDGPHSGQATIYMLERFGIPKRIAAPGYSNHQGGIAIDLKQFRSSGPQIDNDYNTQAQKNWRATWFYNWLKKNAEQHFGFKPYQKEAWHWEYRPSPGQHSQATQGSMVNAIASLPRQLSEAVRKGLFSLQIALNILSGQRDENRITNIIFSSRHPELPRDYKIAADDKASIAEWIKIRNNTVRPLLRALQENTGVISTTLPSVSHTTPVSSPPLMLPAITPKKLGFNCLGGGRLLNTLRRLKTEGRISWSDTDLETLQRMSEVESSGQLVCVQTWDTAYLSFGFLQYTILWGELQELIRRVSAAFARYGISLDGRYHFPKRRSVDGIRGAPHVSDLRSRVWVERFLRAAFDDEIIIAQVNMGLENVAKQTRRLQMALGSHWSADLASSRVRALMAETYNNRPRVITKVLPNISIRFPIGGNEPTLVHILKDEIVSGYSKLGNTLEEREKNAKKGSRLVAKILMA